MEEPEKKDRGFKYSLGYCVTGLLLKNQDEGQNHGLAGEDTCC